MKRSRNILSKKKKSSKKNLRRRVVWTSIIIGCCLILLGAGFFFFYSRILEVKNISISGTRLLDPVFVRESVESEISRTSTLARFLGPDRILFWTLNSRLLSLPLIPAIREADVQAKFLSRSVEIAVDERRATGVLCDEEDNCFAIDGESVPFRKSPDALGGLILKIRDTGSWGIVLGEPFFSDRENMENMLETLQEMKKAELVPEEVRVREKESKEWEAVMPSGSLFIFSFQFVPDDLADVLTQLKENVRMDVEGQFDFRIRNRVFYK